MQIPIIVVGDSGGRFITAIESQRGPVSVVRHVDDLGEMLGVAQSGLARAVLVVTQREDLTHSLINALHQLDIAVCVVADQGEDLSLTGVSTIDSLADTRQLVEAIEQAAHNPAPRHPHSALENNSSPTTQPQQSVEQGSTGSDYTRKGTDNEEPDSHADLNRTSDHTSQPERLGNIVAVWGPLGSPGRTTCAVNLAGAYAESGYQVCLLDADTYGSSVSAVLGLTDDYSSLAQLCHHADRGEITPQTLADLTHTVRHKSNYFDVITGINRPDRWAEIRSLALTSILATLRENYDLIVIDTSFNLEDDETLSFDGAAPQRNDATLTSLREADHIVLVGLADVVGVPRLIKAYDQLTHSLQTKADFSPTIVLNRVRSEAVGPSPQLALEHSWQRFGPSKPISHYLAEDSPSSDKARLNGKTILETSPESALAEGLTQLSQTVEAALSLQGPDNQGQGSSRLPAVVEKKKASKRFLRRRAKV